MKFKNLLSFLLLFAIISFSYAGGITATAQDGKYFKVNIDGKTAYTTENFLTDANYFIGTDKTFYGNNKGHTKITAYIGTKSLGFYKVGIETKLKNIIITGITINGIYTDLKSNKPTKKYIFPNAFLTNSALTTVIFDIAYDPNEIGKLEELYITLHDTTEKELSRLDPFLSNYGYRQEISLDTTQLGANITADHSILIYVPPANDFWTKHTYADYNGITFTSADGTSEYAFDVEKFNLADKNMWVWVKVTDTFTSATATKLYFYYGGLNTNNADGITAYPSTYKSDFHFNQTAGLTVTDATGNYSGLVSSASGWTANNYIDGEYDFAGTRDANSPNLQPTSFTILASINYNGSANSEVAEFQGFRLYRQASSGCVNQLSFQDELGNDLCSTNINSNIWYNTAIKYNSADHNRAIYINGSNVASTNARALTITSNVLYISRYSDVLTAQWRGNIDEIKYFNSVLSDDEIKLLYLSDSRKAGFVTFGTQEQGSQPPDFNFTAFYSYAIYKGGSVVNIPFRVQDPDSNSLLIDLNYSASATQGAGFVIVNDKNTFTFTCDTNNLGIGANCSYNWTMPNADGNYYLLGSAWDDSVLDFNHSNLNFLIDSNAPTLYNQQPPTTYDKNVMPFDFNVSITDGNGSGVLNCIRRLYIDSVPQSDVNIDINAGNCYTSITGLSISCGTKIKVGWYGVDNVYNISAELQTADINYSCIILPTPPVTPTAPSKKETRYFNRTQKQDLTKDQLDMLNLTNTIVLYGAIALILLVSIGVIAWKRK